MVIELFKLWEETVQVAEDYERFIEGPDAGGDR